MKTSIAIAKGLAIGAAMIAVAVLSSCTYTIDGYGNRSFTLSGEQTVRAIAILAEK